VCVGVCARRRGRGARDRDREIERERERSSGKLVLGSRSGSPAKARM
jgi:hypothetical protein